MSLSPDPIFFRDVSTMCDAVLAVIDKYPDSVNAVDEFNVCTYDDGKGGHCIIGQVYVENGLQPPRANCSIAGLVANYTVASAAAQIQTAADNCPDLHKPPTPVPWETLRPLVEQIKADHS